MIRKLRAACLAAMLLVATGCAGTYEQADVNASVRGPDGDVSVSYFYDALAPYGRWVNYSSYGWCWAPYTSWSGWRPYYDGYWVYTDCGWTWASNEPWGWAAYHYGRWQFDPFYGWLWVPDTEWGPAWVAWRYSDDWVGWAPLPPTAGWSVSVGLSFTSSDQIPPQRWCFVQRDRILDSNLRGRTVPLGRNVTIFQQTRDATQYQVSNGRPMNRGMDVTVIERSTGRPVPHWKITDAIGPGRGRGQPAAGGGVSFFRPKLRGSLQDQAPKHEEQAEETPMPAQELQRQQAQEQRKLEASLRQERAELEREQMRERRAVPPGQSAEAIRQKHESEQRAFEQHAAEQRQLLEQRVQKRIQAPGPKGKGDQGEKKDKKQGPRGRDKRGGQ